MKKEPSLSSPLQDLIRLEREARAFGFAWSNHEMILDQIIDECREIKEELDIQGPPDKLQEEIGDLIHAALSLCEFSGFPVEETLQKVNEKFYGRMETLKDIVQEHGLENLQGQSISFILQLWEEAKKRVNTRS